MANYVAGYDEQIRQAKSLSDGRVRTRENRPISAVSRRLSATKQELLP